MNQPLSLYQFCTVLYISTTRIASVGSTANLILPKSRESKFKKTMVVIELLYDETMFPHYVVFLIKV